MQKSVYISGTANKGRSGIGTCLDLEEALSGLNYKISNSPKSDFLINLNHNPNAYRKFLKMGGSPDNCFLILLEPRSVYPTQYKQKIIAKYRSVISPGNPKFNFAHQDFIGWPYTFNINPSKPEENDELLKNYISRIFLNNVHDYESWLTRTINCSMIAANKVSPHKENQYGMRRYFAKNLSPENFEVYGPLWISPIACKIRIRIITLLASIKAHSMPNISSCFGNLFWKYPSARGEIKNKHEILLNSKFSLVVENSNDFVSEKFFDSIINGSIPIYFGPELTTVGIPSDFSFQIEAEVESINEIILGVNPQKISIMLEGMKNFLQSYNFENSWTSQSVYGKIANQFDKVMRL